MGTKERLEAKETKRVQGGQRKEKMKEEEYGRREGVETERVWSASRKRREKGR